MLEIERAGQLRLGIKQSEKEMIEIKINDPEIEKVYASSEEILTLLRGIANKELQVVPTAKSNVLGLTKIKEVLETYFKDKPVNNAYLFGSYARNEAKEESDLDLLVELDYTSKIGTLFFRMTSDLEALFARKVDLLSSEAINETIRESIFKDRVLVYERKN